MYSLYIDTHDNKIVIGLYKDGLIIDNSIKESSRNHSDFTMPMIREILINNSITIKDLTEIIVVNGPGSFTGVRIGVTIAKTLAYTLNISIKTITSLQMKALCKNTDLEKITIIKDVKGVFYGIYNKVNEQIGELEYKSNEEFSKMLQERKNPYILIEEIDVDFNTIYQYMKSKEETIAHKVNPIYIKVIEALKK